MWLICGALKYIGCPSLWISSNITLLRADTVVILAFCEEINFGLQFHRKVIINLFFFMLNTPDKPKALKRDSIVVLEKKGFRHLFTSTIKALTYTYVAAGLARFTHSASIL